MKKLSVVGLCISIIIPLLLVNALLPYLVNPWVDGVMEDVLGLMLLWVICLVLVAYIIFVEKRPLTSIGITKISAKQVALAILMGILCSLIIPATYTLFDHFFSQMGDSMSEVGKKPVWLVFAGICTAAIVEELLIRGYPLERIREITKSDKPGFVISLLAFVVLHINSWNGLHIVGIVLPLGVILTFTYIKTRSLIFVMIVHFLVDFPLLFI
ncbi:MAG: type II CAAX endopeptidase family protein [Chryseolinea sp.]